ncbi:MAG TPA: hypothetical protein VIY48_12060, partial [Candidatus Paceibacterota bacterium]
MLVWFVMGMQAKRTLASSRFLWSLRIGVILAAVLIVGAVRHFNPGLTIDINPLQYQQTLPAAWGIVGALCAALGIGLAIWARLYLGRNWGMPMS